MPLRVQDLSSDLLFAQCRLEKLRQEHGIVYQPVAERKNLRPASYCQTNFLPTHLGWHSQSFAKFLQTAVSPTPSTCLKENIPANHIKNDTCLPEQIPLIPTTLKIYPDIAIGLLQHELAAAGRIWLLLRCLDHHGRGWVTQATAVSQLTDKSYPLRVCGRRQLRNLLAQGENLFWERTNGRIWLRSLIKVAATLGVERLRAKPVLLPVGILTQRIGTVRAHLYATFHSSRSKSHNPQTSANPIARATIAKITHVQPRIQRLYEKTARVKQYQHFGIGAVSSKSAAEENGWQQGRAVFELIDTCGRQGKPGQTYLAWQLPNSYSGPHEVLHGAQRKRDNRRLTDLLQQGTTGNGQLQPPTNASWEHSGRRYCENGRIATKYLAKQSAGDVYWPDQTKTGQIQFWHQIGSNQVRKK